MPVGLWSHLAPPEEVHVCLQLLQDMFYSKSTLILGVMCRSL